MTAPPYPGRIRAATHHQKGNVMMQRWITGLLVLAALGVAVLGVTGAANAEHYHTNCNDHGLVHGSSTSDTAFHARVVGGPCQAVSYCYVGAYNVGYLATYVASPGVTCDSFTQWQAAECGGYADTQLNGRFGWHRHYAHNWCVR